MLSNALLFADYLHSNLHNTSVLVGVMGHGFLGMLAWAQKLYFISHLAVRDLPENFRQFGNTFAWSTVDFASPLDAILGSIVEQSTNTGVAFQPALIRVDSGGSLIDALSLPLNTSGKISL